MGYESVLWRSQGPPLTFAHVLILAHVVLEKGQARWTHVLHVQEQGQAPLPVALYPNLERIGRCSRFGLFFCDNLVDGFCPLGLCFRVWRSSDVVSGHNWHLFLFFSRFHLWSLR